MREEAVTDERLAELWSARNGALAQIAQARDSLIHQCDLPGHYVGKRRVHWIPGTTEEIRTEHAELAALAAIENEREQYPNSYKIEQFERTLAKLQDGREKLAWATEEAKPLEAKYDEAPWSRFFLVNNTGGHIHSSMHCSTCRWDTSFSWLPSLSGLTEKDAVAEHGAILCTVCFPSAPVEWTNGHDLAKAEREAAYCPGRPTGEIDYRGYNNRYGDAKCDTCGKYCRLTADGNLRKHKGRS